MIDRTAAVLIVSPWNYEWTILTIHGVGPRPPEPSDFRFRESSSVAPQRHRVAFTYCDVRTGQVVNDL